MRHQTPTGIELKVYRIDKTRRRGRRKAHGPAARGKDSPKVIPFSGPPSEALRKAADWLESWRPEARTRLHSLSIKFTRPGDG